MSRLWLHNLAVRDVRRWSLWCWDRCHQSCPLHQTWTIPAGPSCSGIAPVWRAAAYQTLSTVRSSLQTDRNKDSEIRLWKNNRIFISLCLWLEHDCVSGIHSTIWVTQFPSRKKLWDPQSPQSPTGIDFWWQMKHTSNVHLITFTLFPSDNPQIRRFCVWTLRKANKTCLLMWSHFHQMRRQCRLARKMLT